MALQSLAREISNASRLSFSNLPLEFSDGQRAPAILMSPAPAKDKSQWISKFSQPKNSSTGGKQLRLATDEAYIASSNWRNSTSSYTTSSSSSTSYSNSSAQSASTQASSLSASSWRASGTIQTEHKNMYLSIMNADAAQPLPTNVKFVTGMPWELSELPNSVHTKSVGDTLRCKEVYKKQNDQLDAIAECSDTLPRTPLPASESQGSTGSHIDPKEMVLGDEDRVPKNVTKEKINTLAKTLSALRQ
ncbi:hypothetical protein PILCRDRAFT_326688 [Piloderma croceum F 1598]|uniref:Uncharacterized protein n=1 Tax=Piloderma croceum (strain F 1598) TaxID=765440 RepID=A0A0C3G3G4_PILCF|nr:hypothetical protein PILCRDRAFT_326688 [Piloderma croceum F 1598]